MKHMSMSKDEIRDKKEGAEVKRNYKRIVAIIMGITILSAVFLTFVLQNTATALANSFTGRTVRVAYMDLGEYYHLNKDGTIRSYDSAYLSMISEYTGIQFEYVDCKTWDAAIEMLQNHEIDLIGNMYWSQERENQFEICDASYGYMVAELVTKEDSDIMFEDYETMNGRILGYANTGIIAEQIENLMEEKNVSFTLKEYNNYEELKQALAQGEIDLFAANAYAVQDLKIVEKFSYAPFYFASWKGNEELTELISETIVKINIYQKDFMSGLIKEYFPEIMYSPYNKQEIDLINKNKTYQIYIDSDVKPIVWYDETELKFRGVFIDVLNQLEQITGLDFEVKFKPSGMDASDLNANTDVLCNMILSGSSPSNEFIQKESTESVLGLTYEMFHRIGNTYDKDENYKIAVAENHTGILEYLESEYKNCEIVKYDSVEECIKQLSAGEVQRAFLNTYMVNNETITNRINNIINVPMTEVLFDTSLQFQGENAEVLADIVNKAIKMVDEDIINESMISYAMNTLPKITLLYFVQKYFVFFVIALILILIIIAVLVFLWIYAANMKQQRNRMGEINRERTDFFARMSHDMRTPMNGILGMLELTEMTSNVDEIKQNVNKAKQSGEYMLCLINDTLDLQRLESNKLILETQIVCMKNFIDEIDMMIRPTAEQKKLSLNAKIVGFEEDLYVKIDVVRVKQIFINILSNAIKFTPEKGEICVLMERKDSADDKVNAEITITDTGIGISKEYIEHCIFKPYSQEYNKMTEQYAGSGLGLAIVKNLIDLMGGSIKVNSEIGKGTTFIINLEVERVEKNYAQNLIRKKEHGMDEAKEQLKGMRVLICEDHELNAEIASKLLGFVGCEVQLASNGKQGVEIFAASEEGSFDVIIMDIQMPVMDGLEAARVIRNMDRADAQTIPIIAMTANAYDTDKENCREAGMTAHLSKPINLKDLYSVLASNRRE